MKKIRPTVSVALVSVFASTGVIAMACGDYTASSSTSTGGTTGAATGGATSCAEVTSPATPPCDIFDKAGQPCVSAHSTVRLLRTAYSGPLYQLCKGTASPGPSACKGTTQDIGVKDGYADSAAHDTFCGTSLGSACTFTKIYDQSGQGNDLEPAPSGGQKPSPDRPANASDLKVTLNGHTVYGILIKPGSGYRTGCSGCNIKTGNGLAKGDEPQSMYMVSSQKDLQNGCCFDYGNAETTSNDDGNGTMEAVYLGQGAIWGSGVGTGPWVMADLENGLYPGWENKSWSNISTALSATTDFVTAIVVGDTAEKNNNQGRFAIYVGDATQCPLRTQYDGIRPEKTGYNPMQKQGSLILGTGGDNSNAAGGRFYEGVMVSGASTKATLDELQAAIIAAKYGK